MAVGRATMRDGAKADAPIKEAMRRRALNMVAY